MFFKEEMISEITKEIKRCLGRDTKLNEHLKEHLNFIAFVCGKQNENVEVTLRVISFLNILLRFY